MNVVLYGSFVLGLQYLNKKAMLKIKYIINQTGTSDKRE